MRTENIPSDHTRTSQRQHCGKVSVLGVFLVCIFPHSDWIRTRKTPNTDTFDAVQLSFSMKKSYHVVKGYLRYKFIFCHTVAHYAHLTNFFIWRKNNLSFSKHLDFCVFVKSTDFKICDVIIDIATWWKLHLCLIWSNTSVLHDKFSKMFLAQCWELETSFRLFYNFIEMIWRDLTIFNSWHLPFLIALYYSPFKKMKHWT